jgi:ribosomal protein S18 acetylase RimI-like enzyme
MKARWYRGSDLPAFLTLFNSCFGPEHCGAITAADLRGWLRDGHRIKVVTGTAGLDALMVYSADDQEYYIRWLAVATSRRRQGLASFLIRTLIGPHAPPGLKRVLAKTSEPETADLLRGLGFTRVAGNPFAWNISL